MAGAGQRRGQGAERWPIGAAAGCAGREASRHAPPGGGRGHALNGDRHQPSAAAQQRTAVKTAGRQAAQRRRRAGGRRRAPGGRWWRGRGRGWPPPAPAWPTAPPGGAPPEAAPGWPGSWDWGSPWPAVRCTVGSRQGGVRGGGGGSGRRLHSVGAAGAAGRSRGLAASKRASKLSSQVQLGCKYGRRRMPVYTAGACTR